MSAKIRVGIVGYGNLGRGVEAALAQNPDMELAAVFTRRGPGALKLLGSAPAHHIDDVADFQGRIDVMILCGGSKNDLPEQGPALAALFNTVNNLSAARSRIEDADYAVEVSNMTRAQILQQAGTSVLAQANQVPQTVLSLLR